MHGSHPLRRPRVGLASAAAALLCAVPLACSTDEPDRSDPPTTQRPTTTAAASDGTGGGSVPDAPARPDLGTPVRLVDLELDLHEPVAAAAVPGSSSVLVAERRGVVREVVLGDGTAELAGKLLDLSGRVGPTSGERGLLGLAVTPDGDGVVLSYTAAADGGNRIERYDLEGDPGSLSLEEPSRQVLLRQPQPYANHNGGHVAFGPDGMLYVGIGDGGLGGDPHGNAQDPTTLLGKLLRIDASGPDVVPADNPFVDAPGGARPEIWATGLRNPWRFSFDADIGDLWVADVGQDTWEEIDHLPAAQGAGRGANFGWDLFEGTARFDGADPAPGGWSDGPFVEPVHTYGRDRGCSVTGGVVYRGEAVPGLRGAYLFADLCGEDLRALDAADPEAGSASLEGARLRRVVSFAETATGEVLVISLDRGVFLLAPAG